MTGLRFGNICEVDAENCRVRVKFQADDVASYWLPVLVQGSLDTKYFHIFTVNELVVCLMDERLENGVCLGAIYSKENSPVDGADGVANVVFSDGAKVQYDTNTSEMLIEIGESKVTIIPDSLKLENNGTIYEIDAVGHDIKKGGESLNKLLTDLVTALLTHTHTSAAPGVPTGPPLPPALADFTALIARIPTLLKP